MQNKNLHIISFDNPYPPNYGGIIDVFYKIKALHALGFKIHLHCFVTTIPLHYEALELLTEEICFYKSSSNPLLYFSKIPFSVVSRNNKKLLENIHKIDAPILFEGLKTTFLVQDKQLDNRFKLLRLHNIEQDYFAGIAKSEKSLFRKIAFYFESKKYNRFETIIKKFDKVLCLSHFENKYSNKKFNNSVFVPVFHGNETVLKLDDMGDYAMYHGDLNTSDNREVVRFLISVFNEVPDYKLVIASSDNEKFVTDLIKNNDNIEFVKFKNFDDLKAVLQNAHINISWSFQKSGTKLKLVSSLFNSRFSIINDNIIDDKSIADLCIQVANKSELILKILELKSKPFTDFEKRKVVLETVLNDERNAQLIANLLP